MIKKHKFITKLFAAIDGYAEIKARDKQHALDLSRTAREIMKPLIEQHNGIWMHERDGKIYINFTAPEDAVNYSVAVQQALQNESEPKLHIGIHTVDFKTGIMTGDVVASGITEMTVSGGVCISDNVYGAIQDRTDIKAEFLKNMKPEGVENTIRVYMLAGEGLAEPVTESSADDSVSAAKPQPSIAVLPFINMSADPEQEYFCDGMSEEIINKLSQIEDLRVIARTSSFYFKGEKVDITDIGKKLAVEWVLEGSVRKAGNRVRVTAQLVKVSDQTHIFSNNYDRDLEDIFAIQDEISLAIVEALKVKLLKTEKAAIVKRHTEDLEAYNLYLKGNYYWQMMTPEGFDKAIECFEQALQKDPHYVLAYTGLSSVYWLSSYFGNVPPNEAYPRAKEYAKKALDIDNTLAEAHASLGFINMNYDWNWKAAEREFKQALQLDPNSALTHLQYSTLLILTERHEEAIAEAKRAQELDPLSSYINTWGVGLAFFNAYQYDRAIEELRMTLTINPNYFLAHWFIGAAYLGKSMFEEAVAEYEKAVDLSGGTPIVMTHLAILYYESGKKDKAEKLFDSLKQRQRNEYIPPMCFYLINKVRGDHDQAFEWVKRACEEHDSFLPWLIVTPTIETGRIPDEPRYRALLKKAGLE